MKNIVRLGIWGCGHGIDGHGVAVKHIAGANLVAICDKDRRKLFEACDKLNNDHPVSCVRDPKKMLSHIDAVIIATLDKDHIDHLKMALDHNLHVMIEKPIAIDEKGMADFKLLLKIAKNKKLILTSCHPRRFDPPFIWLEKNLSKFIEKLGRIKGFHYDFTYHKPYAGWKQISRSLLLDHHGHEIDLVNFLFGYSDFEEEVHDDSADRYMVTGLRGDGIKFTFHGSRHLEDRLFREWMIVRFENGSVTVNTDTGNVMIKNHITKKTSSRKCRKTDYSVRSYGITKNFIDAIRGKAGNYLTADDLVLNNESGICLLNDGKYFYIPEGMKGSIYAKREKIHSM